MSAPSTIYIVVASGGRYDDAWESNQIATFDHGVATAYIADHKKLDSALAVKLKKYHALLNAEYDRYGEANPQPPALVYEEVAVPKWIGQPGVPQVITDEMRAEKSEALAENERRRAIAVAPVTAWFEVYNSHFDAFKLRLAEECELTMEEVKSREYRATDNLDYRIDTIPVL